MSSTNVSRRFLLLKRKPPTRYKEGESDVIVARKDYEKRLNQVQTLGSMMRVLRFISLIFAIISIVASIYAAEIVYKNRVASGDFASHGHDDESDRTKAISTVFTVFLCLTILFTDYISFLVLQLKHQVSPWQTYFTSGLIGKSILKMALASIHCPAGVYGTFESNNPQTLLIFYDWDSILSVFMLFLRTRIVVSIVLTEALGIETPAVRIIAKTMRIRFESFFALRTLLDKKPIMSVLAVYTGCIVLLSYAIRVAERPVCVQIPDNNPSPDCTWKDFESPYNAMWCILVTSLTVGYGDLYPVTNLGRFISVFAAVLGIVLVALVVTAVANLARFNADEERGRILLVRRSLAIQRRQLAARLVGISFLFHRNRLQAGEKRLGSSSVASVAIQVNPADAKTACKPKKVGPVGPPSPFFVRRLATILKKWRNHQENWINSWRHKSINDEVKGDVDELKDSIKELHQKLDATLLGLKVPLLVKPDVTPDMSPCVDKSFGVTFGLNSLPALRSQEPEQLDSLMA